MYAISGQGAKNRGNSCRKVVSGMPMSNVLPWAIPPPSRSTVETGASSPPGSFKGLPPRAAGALTCDELDDRADEVVTQPVDGQRKVYSMMPTCSSTI